MALLRRTSPAPTKAPPLDNEAGSSQVSPIRDVVPDLVSKQQEMRTYYQMQYFDSSVRSSLRATTATVKGAQFYLDPDEDSQDGMDRLEFAEENIFEAPNAPWLQTVSNVLSFMAYGLAILEPVFTTRQWSPSRKGANTKNYTMLKALSPRPARTISEIKYDNNGYVASITQAAIQADGTVKQVPLDVSKLLVFSFDEEGGDIWGKSILRSSYPHWYYKNHLYKIDAIQKERHALGIPRAIAPPGYNKADKQAANEMLENIRTNERARIFQPPGWDFDFLKVEGQTVDVMRSIDHHNAMIMLNVLAEFLLLGVTESGGGGRATSATQQDVFMKSNRSIADLICDAFNFYLIPTLIGYNFDTDQYPRLKVRNLGETRDLQQFAAGLANAVDKEIIIPDEQLEDWARDIFQAPKRTQPRPELSPTQIRELIQIRQNGGASGPSGPGNNGNNSTVGATGGQGNMGKGNNPG